MPGCQIEQTDLALNYKNNKLQGGAQTTKSQCCKKKSHYHKGNASMININIIKLMRQIEVSLRSNCITCNDEDNRH